MSFERIALWMNIHYCMVGELGVKGGIIEVYVRKLQKLCNFLK